MSYENEIKYLKRELKLAKSDYLNARLKSEDALRIHAFKTDVETIEFQIGVFEKASKADEYEAKNKELLEELKYLKKVNGDLVWQRDTDEEHEAKAKAWDKYKAHMESHIAGEVNEEEFVSDLKSDYFESGEYDA